MKREGECVQCGGCCKTMRITGILSHVLAQHGSLDEARAYYSFRQIRIAEVSAQTDSLCFELDIPCDKLTADNRCLLHDKPELKPIVCHRYPLVPDNVASCGYSFR